MRLQKYVFFSFFANFTPKNLLISENSSTFAAKLVSSGSMIGTTEIIVIALIILLLFGGSQIPKLMKGIGKGVRSYKKGLAGEEDDEEKKNDDSKAEQA